MKKKLLFENVDGNTFKMLKENAESKPLHEAMVASGLKKVFENAKGDITYKTIEHVGFGYIKDLTEARQVALKEARILAKEFNFSENEDQAKFVKQQEVERPASEEKREIQIGQSIIKFCDAIETYDSGGQYDPKALNEIRKLAEELIKLHAQ